jgi:alanine dehydrogenase
LGRTSTIALCNATLPYAVKIANQGYAKAAAADVGLADGINMVEGRLTNRAVAESLHLKHEPLK